MKNSPNSKIQNGDRIKTWENFPKKSSQSMRCDQKRYGEYVPEFIQVIFYCWAWVVSNLVIVTQCHSEYFCTQVIVHVQLTVA